MGSSQTKAHHNSLNERAVEVLKNKVRLLQGEVNEIMSIREAESQLYERELMIFAFKEAEWKRERKRLKEEAKKMKKFLEENEVEMMGKSCSLLEQLKEEKARRDETVEKWKQLYFAVKVELDELIQRTHQEKRLCWRIEEKDILLQLKKELKAKEERIELLEAKLASMEHQESKREREMDILRQSLRIMSHRRRATKLRQKSLQDHF
ncbi:hypothetical protein CDL12_28519 [Handroanthus impetiginosus]|uniref:Uncharacterized protein n=1 Tax=Handroanthus impetiginosus TaxID=429701 RepID=A0A2G9G133_9LAMI|nr:hypothetical protein CDL12_28519 [Handroanthus impetiginosus]